MRREPRTKWKAEARRILRENYEERERWAERVVELERQRDEAKRALDQLHKMRDEERQEHEAHSGRADDAILRLDARNVEGHGLMVECLRFVSMFAGASLLHPDSPEADAAAVLSKRVVEFLTRE